MELVVTTIVALLVGFIGLILAGGVIAIMALMTSYVTHPPKSSRPIDPRTGRRETNPWDGVDSLRRRRH